ncbi:hypothetical protein myaer87_28700 [Microcystis aeruginosa NIES-87]|jgi:transposase-like protein|uniref:transposase-like zinc-binding domain-containing protein n=1 Tax=Microcystis TaxID=1125 RepID=UPI000CACB1E5|nr:MULTISPECIES: hypothetical protein [Microcystis]MCA2719461.1 hypothetical protein [Microcystis sp. M169S2]WNF15234.1 hypothetical protein RKE53_01955 [Microcystis aeruginosa NRERC-214]GBE75643.1 hypothetical protein myaer87_28700 [Microcystis aeruginosa NIES-87]
MKEKKGVVKLKDDPNQLGTQITLIARIALHLSHSDLTTPKKTMECPECKSDHINKNGHRGRKQNYIIGLPR